MNFINKDTCYLSEVYSAIQGEGPLVGVRQLFVRFSACDLRCVWCDTPDSLVRTKFCNVEKKISSRQFQKIENPVNSFQLIRFLKNLSPNVHHSISLTGGEPLLQSDFLFCFLPELKKEISLPIYLETGGHRPDELEKVINSIDYISMDFKLPSSANAGDLWDKHRDFLDICLKAKKKVWVKIVVTNETDFDELLKSINIVESLTSDKHDVEVFIQPVTKIEKSIPPLEIELLKMQEKLLKFFSKIRTLPQVHALMGQR